MRFDTESLTALYLSILDRIDVDEELKELLKSKMQSYGSTVTESNLKKFLVGDLEFLSHITFQLTLLNKNKTEIVTLTEKERALYTSLAIRYLENNRTFDRGI